ncbi:hypothetical protein SERLA73DRAFT_182864 [Serpula lacrymans var. lacrymans S7.3]|uniref:Transcription factor CBF/NF-Y/archaeal histone domain-containing protein n=2 Tax=Serpula lacrymans var. lacrymans TaxID=341189 RepID=F8Q147_SERL3|nr:uncharacterized protein SERLADRAFT_469731 [Serpula lacrymans var. lacrymans S7.9]EGN98025.1 hypothetical protein SERLA73DRAFT_182864 [Serpula lacrymans var. lacrymans S7.3]EGO23615.1 hypothetical protein SERLADRAFT_469731 [Serpula lacrymans var. lacrymans S7.9]
MEFTTIAPHLLDAPLDQDKKKREKKESAREREAGKSILPFSRVQRIIKADKDLPMMAKDATFLISLATEEFIKRLADAGQKSAEREKRTTVQQKDIANVVRRADEFLFLEEILAYARTDAPPKRKPKAEKDEGGTGPTLLDKFVLGQQTGYVDDSQDIVMHDDGTMVAG